MKGKAERFYDGRADNRTYIRGYATSLRFAKVLTKTHSALYKALRNDQRFAAVALHRALQATNIPLIRTRIHLEVPLDKHRKHLSWGRVWDLVPDLDGSIAALVSAHIALSDPTKIACYPTRADAKRHREVVMTPGRFFAAVYPERSPAEIKKMAEAFLSQQRGLKVHFIDNDAEDVAGVLGDEWERVYDSPRGFSSCMASWDGGTPNPVRFYARPGNGLSLAYITYDGEPDGEVTARAICNHDKKAFVRCYGDERLGAELRKLKYTQDAKAALDGVECNAKKFHAGIIAPYIDGEMGINWDGASSVCTISSNGRYYGQNTEGYTGTGEKCWSCEEYVQETRYSEFHDRNLCESCIEEDYVDAVYHGSRLRSLVEAHLTVEIDDEYYLNDSALLQSFGFVFSNYAEEWICRDDAVYLTYLDDWVPDDDTVGLDVPTEQGDGCALSENTKEIVLEGKTLTVHEDYDGPEDDEEEEEEEEAVCVAPVPPRTRARATARAA